MWCQSCLWDYYYKKWERWAWDTESTPVPCSAGSQIVHLWCPQTEVRILQKKTVKTRMGGQGQTEWTGKTLSGLPGGPWPTQQWHTSVPCAVPTYSTCRPLLILPSLHLVWVPKATCKYLIHSKHHLENILVALYQDLIFLLPFFFLSFFFSSAR